MSRNKAIRGKRKPPEPAPARVLLHGPMLDAVRAQFPVARDWPDSQVAAACVALVLTGGQVRGGLVHGE